MMRSAAKLAYEQAQRAIDGQTDSTTDVLIEPVLKPLWAAYAALKKQRDAWQGKRVACVLTGGNASMEILTKALL